MAWPSALAVGLDAYRREFGLAGDFLLPANLYGPWDNFDLDTSRAVEVFGWQAQTSLENGLARTAAWYRSAHS